jgi:Xaa-Pro aminopeptidase
MSFPREEQEARIAKARRLMRERGIDGLVVTDKLNFYYFTGQRVPPWMSSRPTILVLPLDGEPAVIDWSGPGMFARLFKRPYPNFVEDRRIYPEVPFTRDEAVDWGLREVLVDRKLESSTLAIELGYETRMDIAVVDFERLKRELPQIRWVDSGPVTWPCRMIKSEWEIDRLKQACAIGGKAWKQTIDELKPGVTPLDIQRAVMRRYLDMGADLDSGPPTTLGATGPGNTFQTGDILYLDGGCYVSGYRMDFTRRAVFGPPTQRQRDEHDRMWEIMLKVTDRIRPGVPVAEVFAYSQSLVEKTGWKNYSDDPAKRIGHGIGLANEPPYINAYDKNVFEEGMSLTPEPKIETVEGLLNPEEHVIVRKNGCEVISTYPDWHLHVVS